MTDSHSSDSSVELISTISCCATEASEDDVVRSINSESSSESSITDSDMDYVLLPRISVGDSLDNDSSNSIPEDVLSTPFNLLSVSTPDQEVEKIRKPERHEARTLDGSYEDAAAYITQYLEVPVKDRDHSVKLLFLQALIVEFGISKQLPASISSATKLLKDSLHVNINDYVARRGKDQGELQQIMQLSKKALRKDLRRSNRRSSLKWVKEHGLNVLLIGFFD
ncbi:uncharacterized protein EDB93DRAFT_1334779 [Suillus bovinus]|uniref:uncharacterized protein n=1 Tax=Suillus bovinus TaxID=48563 RepID=UPI001B87E037|nr:uncharacterized protein EDB93DRAFT_1334779 [Suillus bovinus]KAG2158439.1 hypothetical protein EDB93DRAFT_1334779 [Suillus bovinus]